MLHWLAGQKPVDGSNDPDTTGYVEPPETPAPVFAVRAFKHAIFGTPQTSQPKPRRHSNTENGRPRNAEPKPVRPSMARPKSSSDAQTLAKQDLYPLGEPLSSPTKGILLSPGTAAARKKNVTFGDNVVDNEEKRPLRSGLPDDCPGGFPSIGYQSSDDERNRASSPEKGKGRSKLTDALQQVREESTRRKMKSAKSGKNAESDEELPGELAEPKSESGKYWKREYDIYRMNTQREVKKLITKQKAAKSFALMKDTQCTDLADQLKQEQRKVEKLEARATEFASLIEDLQAELKASQSAVRALQRNAESPNHLTARKTIGRSKSSQALMVEPSHSNQLKRKAGEDSVRTVQRTSESYKPAKDRRATEDDPVQRPSEPYNPSALSSLTASDIGKPGGTNKSMPKTSRVKSSDDIWAQSFNSSSTVALEADKGPPSLPDTGERQTNPFTPLDINTLPIRSNSKRNGSPHSMDVECKSTPDLERVDSKDTSPIEEHQAPSPPLSPSPAPAQRPLSLHQRIVEESTTAAPSTSKENVPPTSEKRARPSEVSAKPSAIWSSFNAPPAGKRDSSMKGKDGRELSHDRIEAARARIAARARVTSKG